VTFDADEFSKQSGQPVEYIDIALPMETYHIACGNRDLVIGSTLYKAIPARRSPIEVPQPAADKQLTISLPVDHDVVRRWLQLGVPPRSVPVTLWRMQQRSQVSEQIWKGVVLSLAVDDTGSTATLNCQGMGVYQMNKYLPTVSALRTCPRTLYDGRCRVDRDSFKVTATALAINGRTVRVDMGSLSRGGTWAELGEFFHVASGERMTIAEQADEAPGVTTYAVLTLQLPIPELRLGDAVLVYAGCKKDITTCRDKFTNQVNFGGMPNLPKKTMFGLDHFGIWED
jgi:uncharacterized phage protein (TIGR02218 family)